MFDRCLGVTTDLPMQPITEQAHDLLMSLVRGTLAIDATAGNGHDTEFLARLVGPQGTVWAFDIQPTALERTAARLRERRIAVEILLQPPSHRDPFLVVTDGEGGLGESGDDAGRVICIEADHAAMADHLPPECRGQIAAVMFNLGYLPGGDKSRITTARSTLAALNTALEFLAPEGVLTVVVYPGHPGGSEEAQAVHEWLERQVRDGVAVWLTPRHMPMNPGPQLLALRK